MNNLIRGRVLYICGGRSFSSANPGRKIWSVVQIWRKLGFDVTHLCGKDITSNLENSSASDYGAPSQYGGAIKQSRWLQFFVRSVSEFRDILHDKKMYRHVSSLDGFDCVWERSSRLHYAGLRYAKKKGLPFVLEWKDHLLPYKYSMFKLLGERIERKKILSASYIVVESEVLKRFLLSKYDISSEAIIVAHNAVDADEFTLQNDERDRVRQKLGIDNSQMLAGYLGSYAFYHDSVRMVKAAAICDKDIRILMVGDGKERRMVELECEKLGLQEKIFFHPPVDKHNVPELLSAIDIAVLPGSTDIICPIKVQEYMAMGIPAVAPDYQCNREVIDHGIDGFLFSPFNERELASVWDSLLEDQDRRKKVGIAAREKVVERFSWQATWGDALVRIMNANENTS